ncbi:Lipoprotein LipO precursor [Paenibacillus konkukensis]|uniref:Lipoprotein LipO n=1 Tax=Paenibacillus konkukensis TaxID=2020716 RepID=A0ABY4RWN3_9BACL|nr:extracellular solute-binding protein [Paenibacillus konkukensis]UQZ86796.1 Lipoprotein LipO precursor [Paenibacillus konkukensis]
MHSTKVAWLALAAGTLLLTGGCKHEAEQPDDDNAAVAVSPAGIFPITKQPATIRIMVMDNNRVDNFATNEFSKWIEETTNLRIEWEVVPPKSAEQKMTLALASGDYPDVFLGLNVNPVLQALYGKDGVFLPLNELIDKYGTETKRVLEEAPYVRDMITTPDGNIYGLPLVNECYHCTQGTKMWINQTWLDKLGLAMPTTTGQFFDVLKAFKEKDPNGNGEADELPLVGATNTPSGSIESFLMESFIESDSSHMFVKDGSIHVAYNQQGWKEGLEYLHRLYEADLLAPHTFTQDRVQLKQLGENPNDAIIGAIPAQNPAIFSDMDKSRWKQYVTVPPLQGPGGWRTAVYNPYGAVTQGAFIITNKAQSPEAAFRLADLLYSGEATFRSNVGRPDKEWSWAEEDDVGIDGHHARWRQLKLPGIPGKKQNVHWSQTGPSYRSNEWRLSQAADPDNPLEVVLYQETKKNYEPYRIEKNKIVPPLFFTSDQAEELADLSKPIDRCREDFLTRAVLGDLDIEAEWNDYVQSLEKLGLSRYLEIYQAAYDRKMAGSAK